MGNACASNAPSATRPNDRLLRCRTTVAYAGKWLSSGEDMARIALKPFVDPMSTPCAADETRFVGQSVRSWPSRAAFRAASITSRSRWVAGTPVVAPSADVVPRSRRLHWAHVRRDCARAASNVRHCVARSRAPSRAWRVKVSRQTRTDRCEYRRERAPPRTSAPPSGTPSPARRKGPSRCAHGSARCADEPPFLKGRKPWTRRPLR